VRGFSNEGVKEGYPLKRRYFAVIGSYNVKTKWLEIDQDNLHVKFLALNIDFSSPNLDPLG